MLIRVAYGVEENQISGAPNWLNSENYNVEAKMDSPAVDELRKLSEDQRKLERERMLQVLLADRLHLTLHRETKELPVYALVIAKNGVKLHKSKLGDPYPNGLKGPDGLPGGPTSMRIKPGEVIIQARPVESLAWACRVYWAVRFWISPGSRATMISRCSGHQMRVKVGC